MKKENLINSDVNMTSTMLASKTFTDIIEQVQNSSLNFQLQLSPFSAVISIKKSFVKDKLGNVLLPSQMSRQVSSENTAALLRKNDQLENDLADLTKKYEHVLSECENAHELLKSFEKHQQEAKMKVEEVISEKLLTSEIEKLKSEIEDRNQDIFYLKKSNKAAKEVSEKLNRVVHENRVRFENEKAQRSKEHKAEVKGWKRELGRVNSKVVKLEKSLKVLVDTNEVPVTVPLKSKLINSDIPNFNPPCYDDADEILDDDKAGSDDSRFPSALDNPAPVQPCSIPPSSSHSQPFPLPQAGPFSPRTPPSSPTCTVSINSTDTSNAANQESIATVSTVQAKLKEARHSGKKMDYESLVILLKNHPWEESHSRLENEDEYDEFEYDTYPGEYDTEYEETIIDEGKD